MAYYPSIPASDGTSMEARENSEFQVFELSDTSFTTPLPLLSTAGTDAAPLVTTAQGVVPPVEVVSPNMSHIFKSGEWVWRRDSFDGAEAATQEARDAAASSASDAEQSRLAAEAAVDAAQAPADEAIDAALERADLPGVVQEAVAGKLDKTEASTTFAVKPDSGGKPVGKGEIVTSIRDHGAIGNGVADDTPALIAAWGAGGRTVLVPDGMTLRITGRNSIPPNTTIQWNNTRVIAGTPDFIFNMGQGTWFKGKLTVEVQSAGARGIYGKTSSVLIEDLEIKGPNPGTGAGNIRTNAVQFEDSQNIAIGKLSVSNYDRPMRFIRSDTLRFGSIHLTNYVTGLSLNGCQDVRVEEGSIQVASPNATLAAGHNGVLMGADTEALPPRPLKNVTLRNIVVRDAGEHAFRIGGPAPTQDIWYDNCQAINAGACGFKVLADDPATHHFNINYINPVVEDCGIEDISRCGFLIQRSKNVTINNPVVRKKSKPFSAYTGIRITECDDVQVSNPSVNDVTQDAIEISSHVGTTEVGNTSNIIISGGLIKGFGRSALNLHSNGATLGPFSIGGGIIIVAGGTATFGNTSTSGTITGVNSIDATVMGTSTMTGSYVNVTARIIGAFPSNPNVNANFANGSMYQDTSTRLQRLRQGAWRRLNNSGNTSARPSDATKAEFFYADNLGKPLWFDGTVWKDAAGTTV